MFARNLTAFVQLSSTGCPHVDNEWIYNMMRENNMMPETPHIHKEKSILNIHQNAKMVMLICIKIVNYIDNLQQD